MITKHLAASETPAAERGPITELQAEFAEALTNKMRVYCKEACRLCVTPLQAAAKCHIIAFDAWLLAEGRDKHNVNPWKLRRQIAEAVFSEDNI